MWSFIVRTYVLDFLGINITFLPTAYKNFAPHMPPIPISIAVPIAGEQDETTANVRFFWPR